MTGNVCQRQKQTKKTTTVTLTNSPLSFPYVDIPALASTDGAEGVQEKYYAFYLPDDERPHGFMPANVVDQMPWTDDFVVSSASPPRSVKLVLAHDNTSTDSEDVAAACNAAFAKLIRQAQDKGIFAKTLGRKAEGEDFRIMGARDYSPPSSSAPGDSGQQQQQQQQHLVQLRRSAAPLFGIANRGAHMTMYVRGPSSAIDDLQIWVPRRSRHLATYPGLLDNTVAGGVRAEESALECIVHESLEEASLPETFVRWHVRAAGAITYVTQTGSGGGQDGQDQQAKVGGYDAGLCVPDVIYVYDLEVPREQAETMVPAPGDDEVEEFYLWDVARVRKAMLDGEFKANTALVMIDFFVRHGIITEDNEKDYMEIVTRLRRRLPIPLTAHAV